MADQTLSTRAHSLAERAEAIELVRVLDAEVSAMLDAARRRRRVLIGRIRRHERLAAAGGVNRPFRDGSPWWFRGADDAGDDGQVNNPAVHNG